MEALLQRLRSSHHDVDTLAVLADLLQERGQALGEALAAILVRHADHLRFDRIQAFACAALRFEVFVFRLAAIPIELVLLPPLDGSARFAMGADPETSSWPHEEPRHEVEVRPFLIARTTVTRAVFAKVMGTEPPGPDDERRPAAAISWNDLHETNGFLARTRTRLPTEAEWEFACRGGSSSAFCFGDTTSKLHRYAWQSWGDRCRAVGAGRPNAYGLFDMHGNIKEWCMDLWHSSYRGAPTDGSAWLEGRSKRRVLRGGSNMSIDVSMRSSAREREPPDRRSDRIGFRVVCSID